MFHKISEDVNIISDEVKLFLCVIFYSKSNQMSEVEFFLYITDSGSLFMYLFIYCYCENS